MKTKLNYIIFCLTLILTINSNLIAQADSAFACELCLLKDHIMDRMDSIGLVLNKDGSTTYMKEKASKQFINEQNRLDTKFGEGIAHFKHALNISDSTQTVEKIQELCFHYKYNESALSQYERDSIIDLYLALRYKSIIVYNYSSFLFELDNLIPEYDSLGTPLIPWKTRIKDHRHKRFIEGELYKLWYETYPENYTIEHWKQDQKDSLLAWKRMYREMAIYFFGWRENDPDISENLLHWKLTYYAVQKNIREFKELKRRFYDEGDKDAYHELSMIYMEVRNGDEKTLELELYAAKNFHWCNAYLNAFQFYLMLNEQAGNMHYNDISPEVRKIMEELLEEGIQYNCSECSDLLKSIKDTGSPYPK